MKGNRQLNQSLQMTAQRAVAGCVAPNVLEGLVGIKEAGGVEECNPVLEVVFVHGFKEWVVF